MRGYSHSFVKIDPIAAITAGDVKFSMITSMTTMWCCRVALCIGLVKVFNMGPMAVWYGMFADWTVRGIVFVSRYFSGKWIKKVI